MKILEGPEGSSAEGFPTLFPSRLRAYGAGPEHDRFLGCPAQYRAKYVEQSIHELPQPGGPREFGSALHEALFHMEQEMTGPEDALRAVWKPHLPLDRWDEAVALLNGYLERGGPMAKYGTLAVEIPLFAVLYEDEDFGPIYFGGIIDWLGLDVQQAQVVHLSDYKSNIRPLDHDEVKNDPQLRGYDWLVHQCWEELGLPGMPHTVAHMDALRWSDVEAHFTHADRENFRDWAEAVARQILRDEVGEEIIGPGCRFCPRKLNCDAYLALPGDSEAIEVRNLDRPLEELWEWRCRAATFKKMMEDGIKEVDALFKREAEVAPLVIGDQQWVDEDATEKKVDVEALHEIVGDAMFYDVASVTQKSLEQLVAAKPERAEEIMGTVRELVIGRRVKRSKIKKEQT